MEIRKIASSSRIEIRLFKYILESKMNVKERCLRLDKNKKEKKTKLTNRPIKRWCPGLSSLIEKSNIYKLQYN